MDISVESRITSLERSNRILKIGLSACLLTGSGMAILGWQKAVPEKITTQALEIVDETGKLRARLDTKNYSTNLYLYGMDGKLEVEMSAPGNGGMLALRDGEGKERARLWGFLPSSGLIFWDKDGNLTHISKGE